MLPRYKKQIISYKEKNARIDWSTGIPRGMHSIKQEFEFNKIEDIELETIKELDRMLVGKDLKAKRIGIAVGSRGINNLKIIIKSIVDFIKDKGGNPFIVPAMGSHGGGNVEGRIKILAGYQICEESLGVEVLNSGKVNCYQSSHNIYDKFYISDDLDCSDGIILVNRVKQHTSFVGEYESGLMKMMMIGLGNEVSANYFHQYGFNCFPEMIRIIGNDIINTGKVLGGIGIIENSYGKTHEIIGMPSVKIPILEKEALIRSKQLTPRIPFDDIDILIVEEIGKHISGDGMDPKVIGRGCSACDNYGPRVKFLIVLDLHELSHGNALGMGYADFITETMYNKIDYEVTNVNALTARAPYAVRTPIVMESEKLCISEALRCLGNIKDPRIVRIKNTSDLGVIQVSDILYKEYYNS